MKLLTFAHKSEYKNILSFTNIIKKNNIDKNILLMELEYKNKNLHLLQTGIGRDSTVKALNYYLQKYTPEFIYNFGIAGALNNQLKTLEIVKVKNAFSENNSKSFNIPICNNINGKNVNLLTVVKPLINNALRDIINSQNKYDVVDMESYFIAKKAIENKIPINIIKIISDNANDDTIKSFKKNLIKCSELLGNIIKDNWLLL
ncbi:MAG: hypothetical protein U9R41_03285 [Candidatus Marinimicrobia bacterium]|nr:hypothetical protein [Candidatus Neomarinimicrobiota bacterium]